MYRTEMGTFPASEDPALHLMDTPAIDLLDADFYVNGARNAYAWMRRNAPVYFDGRTACGESRRTTRCGPPNGTRPCSRVRAAAAPTPGLCRG